MNPSPNTPSRGLTPAERKALALQRLEHSRSQLIVHIYPEPEHRRASAGKTSSASLPLWDGLPGLVARAERNGFLNATWRTARALARRWWTRQPWHASVDLVASTLAHEAQPIIRRHPWATLAVGSAAGAAVVVVLPWATRSLKAQAAPWRNNLGGMLWQQLGQTSVQLALTGALTAWITDLSQRSRNEANTAKASASPEPATAPDPHAVNGAPTPS